MLRKIIFSGLILTTLFSCSSDSSSSPANAPAPEVTPAMTVRIDGTVHDSTPQGGNNTSDPTGGTYGNTYYQLKAQIDGGTGKTVKVGNKVFNISLVIPKSDITTGTHNFTATIAPGGYFADFKITGVNPAETSNTTSGYVTVTSYDTSTKLLKGNFNFTTNDGAAPTHTLSGSFIYILQ